MLQRIITGVVLVIILVAALSLGGWFFAVPFMICNCVSMYEMFRALRTSGAHTVEWPTYLCFLLSVPVLTLKMGGTAALLPLLAGACMLNVVTVLFRPKPDLNDVLYSSLPMLGVLLPGMCMLGLFRSSAREVELMLEIMPPALTGTTLFGIVSEMDTR